jgi:hypothetical protein
MEDVSFDNLGLLLGVIEIWEVIFTYSESFLIHSILRLCVMWNLFMCSLDHHSMHYNCSILHLGSCAGEVC